MPEAQLDRFIFKINMEFPTLDELKRIMDVTVTNTKPVLNPVLNGSDIIEMRELIRDIPVADAVQEYALKIVLGTHPELASSPGNVKKYFMAGASPRAAQAIFLTAKARALLDGRYNVSFDDVDAVALPALRHRVMAGFEAVSEGINVDDVLKELKKYGKEEYVNLFLAVIMQESSGEGEDVFQCSESLGKAPNSIKRIESITHGVKVLCGYLDHDKVKVSSPWDIDHIKIALQAYNYGGGYITYINDSSGFGRGTSKEQIANLGKWTQKNALE